MANGTPITGVSDIIANEIHKLRDDICKLQRAVKLNSDTRIEQFGQSGNNGRIGTMRKDIHDLEAEQKSQKKSLFRIALWAAGATTGGIGGGYGIAKLLLGG